MRAKKLFLCCYAISSSEGSEAGVGFGWLLAARKAWVGEIILLCSVCDPSTQSAIEQLGNIEIVEFGVLFHGKENTARFFEKPIFRFFIHHAYQGWLDRVVDYVGAGSEDDIFHYVNYVGFRFKVNLNNFTGRIVRGPVGGAAYSSWSNILSAPFLTGCYLCLRNVKNWIDVLRVKNAYCCESNFFIFATSTDKSILGGNIGSSAVHSEIVFHDDLLPKTENRKTDESVQKQISVINAPNNIDKSVPRLPARIIIDAKLAIANTRPIRITAIKYDRKRFFDNEPSCVIKR